MICANALFVAQTGDVKARRFDRCWQHPVDEGDSWIPGSRFKKTLISGRFESDR
jgi:hypothetical protein